ncbi:tol-pal system-associated acyl-CoA thioesterase [Alkalimarinus sediminis]|uniref:Tol-pal system-associated acyl-CoA thioesterase n=1 Tax=Alkalimarinus sediminis TaxID=1632866 RepID=A0A9E8HLR2_9ALTE|nr:tol-pal system-associated acyl-CoA thioesterase [Alkalimarinus sediminis]UZW76794.1 tol-pal system-associated acyl-CoA thioesterase [Alkalimarinus sediminis]
METQAPSCFNLPIRVYIEDTDAGGIVFYANYLKFMERARTEYIRSLGVELRAGMQQNISYVVHSLEVKYHKPAKLDDLVTVTAVVAKVGKTYLIFDQQVVAENKAVLVSAQVKVACVSLDTGKPRAIDTGLINAIR